LENIIQYVYFEFKWTFCKKTRRKFAQTV